MSTRIPNQNVVYFFLKPIHFRSDQYPRPRSKIRGFTLIELVVVIAVISILVLLGTTKFNGKVRDAEIAAIKHDAKVLGGVASLELFMNHDFLQTLDFANMSEVEDLIDSGEFWSEEGLVTELPLGVVFYKVPPDLIRSHLDIHWYRSDGYIDDQGKGYLSKPVGGTTEDDGSQNPVEIVQCEVRPFNILEWEHMYEDVRRSYLPQNITSYMGFNTNMSHQFISVYNNDENLERMTVPHLNGVYQLQYSHYTPKGIKHICIEDGYTEVHMTVNGEQGVGITVPSSVKFLSLEEDWPSGRNIDLSRTHIPEKIIVSGLSPTVWQNLAERLGYEYEFVDAKGGTYTGPSMPSISINQFIDEISGYDASQHDVLLRAMYSDDDVDFYFYVKDVWAEYGYDIEDYLDGYIDYETLTTIIDDTRYLDRMIDLEVNGTGQALFDEMRDLVSNHEDSYFENIHDLRDITLNKMYILYNIQYN